MKKHFWWIFGGIFSIAGIGLLIGAIYSFTSAVSFLDEEKISFRSKVGENPSSYSEGDNVQVLYSPTNPKQAQIKNQSSNWILSIMLGIMGLVFAIVGSVIIFFAVKKRQLKQWLKQNGKHITAEITQISADESITINGQHPSRIFSQYKNPSDGKTYFFKSDALWDNPLPSKTVEILVDPADYKRYFVNFS